MKTSSNKFKFDLVQPNKVTEAKYDYNGIQENVLTCVMDAIQEHLTQESTIETDLFGDPVINIKAGHVGGGNTKHRVINECRKIMKKDINFEWSNNDLNQTEEVFTSLLTYVSNIKETDNIRLGISKWAIPYLVYWGKGVGGTIYNKKTALMIQGGYSKRIYKLCCKWKDRGGFTMSLDKFRQMMNLENKYPAPKDLRKRILEPSKQKMKELAEIYFEYSLGKIDSRAYNTITFKIHSNVKNQKDKLKNSVYSYCWAFMNSLYPTSDKGRVILDKVTEEGSLTLLSNRIKRLDDDYSKGKLKTKSHFDNTLKLFLKNDLGQDID